MTGKPTRGEGAPTIGIVAGRLEEWAQVIRYLIDHPEESALAVRARYQAAAAPAYADRRAFRSIEAHLEAPSGGALG